MVLWITPSQLELYPLFQQKIPTKMQNYVNK